MAPDSRQRGLAGVRQARKRARRGDARPPRGFRGCGGFCKGKRAYGPGGAGELVGEIGTGSLGQRRDPSAPPGSPRIGRQRASGVRVVAPCRRRFATRDDADRMSSQVDYLFNRCAGFIAGYDHKSVPSEFYAGRIGCLPSYGFCLTSYRVAVATRTRGNSLFLW